jgi:hypothetical protein
MGAKQKSERKNYRLRKWRSLARCFDSLERKTQGASTNEKGEFALVASEGDILVISYVGYIKEEIKIGTATNLSIQLRSDVTSLGEVVVVGYGTQSRRNITSSIGKLEKDILANAPRANLGTALQGSLAGLQVINRSGTPGAAPTILLRGELQSTALERH